MDSKPISWREASIPQTMDISTARARLHQHDHNGPRFHCQDFAPEEISHPAIFTFLGCAKQEENPVENL
jgi:hypothetical protein